MQKIILFSLIIFCLLINNVYAENENSVFNLVMVDKETEKKMGNFPYDREIYAKAIKILKQNGAKAIILKFFLVTPKTEKGDNILSNTIKDIPVFLQASIDINQKISNNLPENFSFRNIKGDLKSIFEGKSGLIPLEKFSNNSFDVGFVNVRDTDFVPLISNYNGKIYKSLYFSIMSYIFPNNLYIESGSKLIINKKNIKLNEFNEVKIDFPLKDEINYISFANLLDEKFDKKEFKDKIIILGYDGEKSPKLETKLGLINAHRAFYYQLQGIYQKIK
jgi:acid stress-induced BolA-like protein IbaG/YrbA